LILDGKLVAQKVLAEVRAGVARLNERTGVTPTLAVVLVGDFAPSKIYIANKKKAADSVGIASRDHIHPEGLSREALLGLLGSLNGDPGTHGILLQLPLVPGLDEDEAIAIAAYQDRRPLPDLQHALGDFVDPLRIQRLAPFHRHVDVLDPEDLILHQFHAPAIVSPPPRNARCLCRAA